MDRLNIIKINNLCVKEYLQESDAYVYGVFCWEGGAKKVLRLVCCGGFTAPWTYYQDGSEYCKWVNLMACEYDSVKMEKKFPLSFW